MIKIKGSSADVELLISNSKDRLKEQNFEFLGQNLLLHPYKAMFWKEQNMLVLTDLHLGKAGHFRKSGIPIPDSIHEDDLSRLRLLLKLYQPHRLVILGDLFHSSYNSSWETVRHFFEGYPGLVPELIMGNHDILDYHQYSSLHLHHKPLAEGPFIFSHEPLTVDECGTLYNICGHIHPGVLLRAPARQSLRAQCFCFTRQTGFLPSFGLFTGMATTAFVKRSDNRIFIISPEEVIEL